MKILVTGGAGFIGSHIVDALIGHGHDVHVMDDFSSGRDENVHPKASVHRLDIRSEEAAACMQEQGYEVMFHLAAQMDVRKSVADPREDADINVGGFLNLMEAGRRQGLKKVVFASTGGAIYGEPDHVPQSESHRLQPLSPYGITKLTTEKYLFFYHNQYGIDFVALRYGNIYGPRQNPHGEAGVIAIFTERLLNGDEALIFGDGEQTRDYVFVGDVVAANLKALAYASCGIFNIGTATETDVNTLFRTLRDLINPSQPEQRAPGKPGEQRRSVLGYTLAQEQLGWSPQVSLQEGLAQTVDWFKQQAQ